MLDFCNAALFLHTLVLYCAYFLRYVSWRRLRLGDAFYLGEALSWRHLLSRRRARLAAPSFLETRVFGDAFFLGDACVSETPSFLATRVFGDTCRHFEREKDKDWNQGKVFLELLFLFIWVTSLKNPRKGKWVSPSTRLLHGCLHKSTKIKLQVGCIPAARNGTPLQGLQVVRTIALSLGNSEGSGPLGRQLIFQLVWVILPHK